jgi:SAM-dependent methyltransferase
MNYKRLIGPIEETVRRHGATPQGVWFDKGDNDEKCVKRFEAMFEPLPKTGPLDLLDVGCGPGLTLDYLEAQGWLGRLNYYGVDLSPLMIEHAKRSWPNWQFEVRDIIRNPLTISFDYAVLNGAFTSKGSASYDEMEEFVKSFLIPAWRATKVCLCFNVMSTHVDWRHDDLFHWPMDSAAEFCKQALSRHIVIRADYGLYEYTVQVYREARGGGSLIPARWQS